jgi:hypothetical protein
MATLDQSITHSPSDGEVLSSDHEALVFTRRRQ